MGIACLATPLVEPVAADAQFTRYLGDGLAAGHRQAHRFIAELLRIDRSFRGRFALAIYQDLRGTLPLFFVSTLSGQDHIEQPVYTVVYGITFILSD